MADHSVAAPKAEAVADIIYHYTNAPGLEGIVRSNRLWATDVSFMNDATELTYGRPLLLAAVRGKVASTKLRVTRELLNRFEHEYLESPVTYASLAATCFCEEGDLLSMWRAYGTGGGYAVGFNAATLHARKIVYDPLEQRKQIDDVLDRWSNKWERTAKTVPEEVMIADQRDEIVELERLGGETGFVLSQFKHPAFKEEKERRIIEVYRGKGDEYQPARYRVSGTGYVPYLELDRRYREGERKDFLPIERVIFGPSMHPELTEKGLRLMLDIHGYSHVQVQSSQVPLRPFAPSSAR